LQDSGTIVLKFFLHISRKEQHKRISIRLKDSEKMWKYNPADKKEAKLWDDYLDAYQAMINKYSKSSPWLIVPSDHKWYRNNLIAKTMVETLEGLKMKYPSNIQ
jgi:polyphosphate kinase 2 (PPK2 family)